jgi:hypothetical protein
LMNVDHSDLQGHETTASLSCCRQALMSVPCNARVNMASILKGTAHCLHGITTQGECHALACKGAPTNTQKPLCCNLSGCCRLHVQKLITVLPTNQGQTSYTETHVNHLCIEYPPAHPLPQNLRMPAATRGDILAHAQQPALLNRGQAAWHLFHTGCQPWLAEVCKCPASITRLGENGCALQRTPTPPPLNTSTYHCARESPSNITCMVHLGTRSAL